MNPRVLVLDNANAVVGVATVVRFWTRRSADGESVWGGTLRSAFGSIELPHLEGVHFLKPEVGGTAVGAILVEERLSPGFGQPPCQQFSFVGEHGPPLKLDIAV